MAYPDVLLEVPADRMSMPFESRTDSPSCSTAAEPLHAGLSTEEPLSSVSLKFHSLFLPELDRRSYDLAGLPY